jgi:DNA polymerase epsilon subunit 1
VDIDVHDLSIAALSDTSAVTASAPANANVQDGGLSSPNSVALFDSGTGLQFAKSFPLGDEMSTSISLAIVRALVSIWLRDAFSMNSLVADELLHHVYRLVSRPDTLMHDPALHRIVHSLMKSTFLRLLGELQRLGCSIVHATFQKVTVATNKATLAEAEEYIDFVISTIRGRSASGELGDHSESLARVALRPRQFHSHFLFLDEYNYGTMHLERHEQSEEQPDFVIQDVDNPGSVIVPTVVTAWSVMHYLGSEIAQEYFRVIIARFSKDILRKQVATMARDDGDGLPLASIDDRVLAYKKTVITRHFASSLTRAVSEILRDGVDDQLAPPFLGPNSCARNPALEFIKNVIVVLELDSEVESEVQTLKRSLFAQVGVAEYSKVAQWINPCPTFLLPDTFCSECHESRDINLCYVPPAEGDEGFQVSAHTSVSCCLGGL